MWGITRTTMKIASWSSLTFVKFIFTGILQNSNVVYQKWSMLGMSSHTRCLILRKSTRSHNSLRTHTLPKYINNPYGVLPIPVHFRLHRCNNAVAWLHFAKMRLVRSPIINMPLLFSHRSGVLSLLLPLYKTCSDKVRIWPRPVTETKLLHTQASWRSPCVTLPRV